MLEFLDISHWQGRKIDWDKMKAAGIKGLWIKCSQGKSYQDPDFGYNYDQAVAHGMQVGAYHFVTQENAIDQFNWFMQCLGGRKLDIRPDMDCEAYTPVGQPQTAAFDMGWQLSWGLPPKAEEEVHIVKELRYGTISDSVLTVLEGALGYIYVEEAVVDSLGRRLALAFPQFGYPSIYTNIASGNRIFKSASMKKYPLHIAHWGVQVPGRPTVWKGQPLYAWQKGVIQDGSKYGVPGPVDYDEYYGAETPPTPPPADTMHVIAYPEGIRYEGDLRRVA